MTTPERVILREWEVRLADGRVYDRFIIASTDPAGWETVRRAAAESKGTIFFRDDDRLGGGWNEWIEVPSE